MTRDGILADEGDLIQFDLDTPTGTRTLYSIVLSIDEDAGTARLQDLSNKKTAKYADGQVTYGRGKTARVYRVLSVRGTRRPVVPPVRRYRMVELVDRLQAALDASTSAGRMVRIPDFVLAWPHGVADAKAALLAGAEAGLVELRPESGIGLLSARDAELCPLGPTGRPLSYARLW